MNYQIRYHRLATSAIYRIERGTAGLVTEAIRRLGVNPRPEECEPVPEYQNVYTMDAEGYTVTYEVDDMRRIINVSWIE
jgi:mRNA-degrading endonuclease RelE of RelBE toxin-antitoxin system